MAQEMITNRSSLEATRRSNDGGGELGMPTLDAPQNTLSQACPTGRSVIPVVDNSGCLNVGPDKEIMELRRNIYNTTGSVWFVADDGRQLVAGFTEQRPGPEIVGDAITPLAFVIRLNMKTYLYIRNMLLTFDPYALDFVAQDVALDQFYNSYGQTVNSVHAGRILVDNQPDSTVIPIDAIQCVGGIWGHIVGAGDGVSIALVSAVLEATHDTSPARIMLKIEDTLELAIFLQVLNRSIADADYQGDLDGPGPGGDEDILFFWTGTFMMLVQQSTDWGVMAVNRR